MKYPKEIQRIMNDKTNHVEEARIISEKGLARMRKINEEALAELRRILGC